MKSSDRYEAKLHSESVNKWTREIEDRFDIEANGSTPTERMNNALDKLDKMIKHGKSSEEIREFIRNLISNCYKTGAKRGAAEMLKDLMWYDILPDDIEKLKNLLAVPISNGDSLLWNSILKFTEHPSDDEQSKMRVVGRISYNEIFKKLETIR